MNSKLLMTSTAVILGFIGISLTFLPQEISEYMGVLSESPIIFQLLGALYFAFAMINWMAKGSLIAGIYGRPIVIGNLTHFVIGALALIKLSMNGTEFMVIWIVTGVYLLLAILFSYVMFTHPVQKK
ncbi:MAG: hypothetical protein GY816_10500 [Cytophagales bacterium]|nr:hypothetical protein [Cytophagales bacterium]